MIIATLGPFFMGAAGLVALFILSKFMPDYDPADEDDI